MAPLMDDLGNPVTAAGYMLDSTGRETAQRGVFDLADDCFARNARGDHPATTQAFMGRFHGYCPCGWHGPRRMVWEHAAHDARRHRTGVTR